MTKTNLDIFNDQVARLRLADEPKPEKIEQPKAKALPIPPVVSVQRPVQLIKPDYMQLLIEAVKLEGLLKIQHTDLAALVGFSDKDRSALNSFLREVYARGISYSLQGNEITFSVRKL